MRASDKLGLVFVHVPKTGGTSVIQTLEQATDDLHAVGKAHLPAFGAAILFPEWPNYRSFAFVRNPWDRLVSAYAFTTKRTGIGFEQFVYEKREFSGSQFWPIFQPQVRWTHDTEGKCLIDFVGRYETLREDFAKICPSAPPILHLNTSEHQPYRDYYTADLRDRVGELFAADIAAFGYQF